MGTFLLSIAQIRLSPSLITLQLLVISTLNHNFSKAYANFVNFLFSNVGSISVFGKPFLIC